MGVCWRQRRRPTSSWRPFTIVSKILEYDQKARLSLWDHLKMLYWVLPQKICSRLIKCFPLFLLSRRHVLPHFGFVIVATTIAVSFLLIFSILMRQNFDVAFWISLQASLEEDKETTIGVKTLIFVHSNRIPLSSYSPPQHNFFQIKGRFRSQMFMNFRKNSECLIVAENYVALFQDIQKSGINLFR